MRKPNQDWTSALHQALRNDDRILRMDERIRIRTRSVYGHLVVFEPGDDHYSVEHVVPKYALLGGPDEQSKIDPHNLWWVTSTNNAIRQHFAYADYQGRAEGDVLKCAIREWWHVPHVMNGCGCEERRNASSEKRVHSHHHPPDMAEADESRLFSRSLGNVWKSYIEPHTASKGLVARSIAYMLWRYAPQVRHPNGGLHPQVIGPETLLRWLRNGPVPTEYERARNRRYESLTFPNDTTIGVNPFVVHHPVDPRLVAGWEQQLADIHQYNTPRRANALWPQAFHDYWRTVFRADGSAVVARGGSTSHGHGYPPQGSRDPRTTPPSSQGTDGWESE